MIRLKKTLQQRNHQAKVEAEGLSIPAILRKRKILNLSFSLGDPLSKARPKVDHQIQIQVYLYLGLVVDNLLLLPVARERMLNLIMKTMSKIRFKMK
jgi:hypothetical protein